MQNPVIQVLLPVPAPEEVLPPGPPVPVESRRHAPAPARQVYCKDGTCKPNERKHMMVVILLLHLNCFAQYALCGLNPGYRRPQRPVIGVALTMSVAICAPAVAGLYNNLSPLGKDYEAQPEADDEESQLQRKTPETERSVDDEAVRDALRLAGVFLCVLYGGFWRIQMRRRFGLPENHACCGKPDLTDCLQWLCCYSCSLAQEEELSTMQEPLRFAGVFASPPLTPTTATGARSVNDGVTVPPSSVSATRT
ncbi:unnamed protein product [Miscanthus lutarioriparius]|uniref:Uncharacterized protein n=1 Tax=Miscanthus lutarioriparius TaxID=422564 RepID=A0A811Q454_9POAL|nr:unnamed protein product [Miscanthus lutarioriparius]